MSCISALVVVCSYCSHVHDLMPPLGCPISSHDMVHILYYPPVLGIVGCISYTKTIPVVSYVYLLVPVQAFLNHETDRYFSSYIGHSECRSQNIPQCPVNLLRPTLRLCSFGRINVHAICTGTGSALNHDVLDWYSIRDFPLVASAGAVDDPNPPSSR